MQIPPGIQALADHGALYAVIGQRRLADRLDQRLGEYSWEVDLAEGWIRFVATADPQRFVQSRLGFVASIAPGPRSLLWGWAHPQAIDASAAERIRALGEQHGFQDLTVAEVPLVLADGDDVDAAVAALSHVVAAAAVEATGRTPYYSAPAGGGSRIVFLLPDIDLGPVRLNVDGAGLGSALLEAATSHQRNAVMGFARHSGFGVRSAPDGSSDEIADQEGSRITVSWDAAGRPTDVSAQLAGVPEPPAPG